MRFSAMIIALGASFLPSQIIKMNFITSLIISTIVYYIVYKIIKDMLEI